MGLLVSPKGAMTPVMPLFSPMMPYGSGLTPQPVTNTNSLSILEEQQRLQQQQQAQQANTGESMMLITLRGRPYTTTLNLINHTCCITIRFLN